MKFSELTQQAFLRAGFETQRLGHEYVGTEHLLLGLLGDNDKSEIAVRLEKHGINVSVIRAQVESIKTDVLILMKEKSTNMTPRARQVVTIAEEEAAKRKKQVVEPEDVLRALIYEGEGVAARVLENLGLSRKNFDEQFE